MTMQKEIQLTDKTLLVVGFNTTNPIFIQSGLTSEDPIAFKLEYNLASTETIVIPKGDWQLVGIYPELTEEMAKIVVEANEIGEYKSYKEHFTNPYFFGYKTALESFQSLMEREQCYTVNPYSEFECPNHWCENGYIDQGYGDKWRCEFCQDNEDKEEEAQQTTFDKYAILIKSK